MEQINVPWLKLTKTEFDSFLPKNDCILCGASLNNDVQISQKLEINSFEFSLLFCAKCGLYWLSPQYSESFLQEEMYNQEYFGFSDQFSNDQIGIFDNSGDASHRRIELAKLRFDEIEREIEGEKLPFKRLLEIGGGPGAYLINEASNRMGFETYSIDISEYTVQEIKAKGGVAFQGTLETVYHAGNLSQKFDLCLSYDVFEHLASPDTFLTVLSKVMVPNGYVVFRIPNTLEHPSLHLVDHLYHWNLDNFRAFIAQFGFKIERSFNSGVFSIGKKKIQNITIIAVFHKKNKNT